MTTARESIEAKAASLGLAIRSEFVPFSKSRSKGEKLPSLNWRVTLTKDGRDVHTFDYSAGCAHAPAYKNSRSVDGAALLRWECENGRAGRALPGTGAYSSRGAPLLPSLADVLYSLVLDGGAIEHPTYESWASEYGYDADSRKGEATYRECLEIGLRLRAALGDKGLAELAEAVQDY